MKKIILLLLLVCSINFHVSANEEPSELYAQSAVLIDGESGRVLFSKNGTEPMANASTTKIMTCILALEYGTMTDVVTVSANAAAQPKVHLGVSEGDQFILQDLLYSLMLESHNDSAVMIAEHIAGSVEEFTAMMNQKAIEIGCTDTYFITPNGLDATDEYSFHHTTANDLVLIMRYCINESYKNQEFLEITGTSSYYFQNVSQTSSYSCTNHNSLLTMMPEAISGKTGYTNDAGYCYVGAIESEGRSYIVALLACGWPSNSTYKWSDAKTLFQYGMDEYDLYELDTGSNDTTTLYMDVQLEGEELEEIPLKIESSESISFLKKEEENVTITYEYPTYIEGEIEEGTLVGTIRYSLDDTVWKVDGIYAAKSLINRQRWWELMVDYFNALAYNKIGMNFMFL